MELPEVQRHLQTEMVQTQPCFRQMTSFMQREVDQWARPRGASPAK
jgi:hypothetical protein